MISVMKTAVNTMLLCNGWNASLAADITIETMPCCKYCCHCHRHSRNKKTKTKKTKTMNRKTTKQKKKMLTKTKNK